MLGRRDEVVEHVLFLQLRAGLVPFLSVLAAAAQVGDREDAAQPIVVGEDLGEGGAGVAGRTLDREKVEDFKTRFYKFEGFNPENGYPTRDTLEKMNLGKVADALKKKDRLG